MIKKIISSAVAIAAALTLSACAPAGSGTTGTNGTTDKIVSSIGTPKYSKVGFELDITAVTPDTARNETDFNAHLETMINRYKGNSLEYMYISIALDGSVDGEFNMKELNGAEYELRGAEILAYLPAETSSKVTLETISGNPKVQKIVILAPSVAGETVLD